MGRIIVIEDNPIFADYVCRLLASKGFQSVSTFNCNGARKLFAKMQEDDIVLADMRLPDGDGIVLLEELRKQGRNNPYIVMTEHGEIPIAVRSLKLGAEDFIPKDLLEMNLPPLLRSLQKRMERQDASILERTSEAFKKIYDKIRLVAPTNMSVLILGESGTGKEHIAAKIHARSKRAGKPFVPVDCGLLSKELAASELFGHEKGAFTGAESKKQGFWEEAAGGTLFLDEIGNLPPWGGNVRELKRVVRMAVLHTEGDMVTTDALEFDEMPLAADASLALNDMEKKQIIHALEQAKGNRTLAAELLGIGRTTLYSKMKEYGIKYKE